MKRVQRYDSARVKAHFDENGFLVDRPVVARIGLQVYFKPDGSERREFRPASEVFKADSLASFQGKPITLGHTMVNSKNAKGLVVGACSGAGIASGVGVEVPISVYDDTAISKAKNKEAAELSVGYTSRDLDFPGWGNEETGEYAFDKDIINGKADSADGFPPAPDERDGWVRFDAVQTDIQVNHVAMVFKGRAGIAKINLDAEQEFPYDDGVNQSSKEDNIVMTVKIKFDGQTEHEVPEAVAEHINSLAAQVKAAGEKADSLEAERDQMKVKLDAVPTQIEEAVAKAKADAAEFGEIVKVATEAGIKTDGLSAKEIKVAYIKEFSGVDASQKSDSYINDSFDLVKASDKMASQRIATAETTSTKSDSEGKEVPDPQKRFRK